jgi:hypothetical protein
MWCRAAAEQTCATEAGVIVGDAVPATRDRPTAPRAGDQSSWLSE